jgi:hypothetical protein
MRRGAAANREGKTGGYMQDERDWMKAVERTWIVRFPKQSLATFGSTNISYYVVTEPVFQDEDSPNREGVVRTGKVIAEKPSIVTPTYALNLKGFSTDAYEYLEFLSAQYGPNSPGILYQYRNETEKTDITGGVPEEIARRISDDLESRNDNLSVVMVGVDEYWDVALLKFIYEFTSSSAAHNTREFRSKGLLDPQPGLGDAPRAAVQHIERLFLAAERGSASADDLKQELDRWGLFDYFQDRFFALARRRRR